jgi:hypothetical protein
MIIRKVTIMMVVLHASLLFLAAAGAGEVFGVSMQSGVGEAVASANNAAEDIGSGPVGVVEAVAGVTIAALQLVASVLQVAFAGPQLFRNLGVPGFITAFFWFPLYIVVAIDFVSIMRGFRI